MYLQSDHWKVLRSEKLGMNPKCEKCGRDHSLDVHHVRYKKIFDVMLSDLMTLCRKCHDDEHDALKAARVKTVKHEVNPEWRNRLKGLKLLSKKERRAAKMNSKDASKRRQLDRDEFPDFIVMTRKLIKSCKTSKGGYTALTVRAFGFRWGQKKWAKKLIGKTVTKEQFKAALIGSI